MTDGVRHDHAKQPADGSDPLRALDVDALRDEVDRLRAIVGPDEHDYVSLKLEMWAARDLVVGLEAELGNVRGRCMVLERELHIRDVELKKLADADQKVDSTKAKLLRKVGESTGKLRF
jgi:hypothetical protein